MFQLQANDPKLKQTIAKTTDVPQSELRTLIPLVQCISKMVNHKNQSDCMNTLTKKINKLLGCERSFILKMSTSGYKIYWNFEYDSLKWNYEADKAGANQSNKGHNVTMQQVSDPTSIDIPLKEIKFFEDVIENQEVKYIDNQKYHNHTYSG